MTPKQAVALFVMALCLLWLGSDAVQFHQILHDGNPGFWSWYPKQWWKAPYTHFRVAIANPSTHPATNVVGDRWIIEEAQIGAKTFWTVLYRPSK